MTRSVVEEDNGHTQAVGSLDAVFDSESSCRQSHPAPVRFQGTAPPAPDGIAEDDVPIGRKVLLL